VRIGLVEWVICPNAEFAFGIVDPLAAEAQNFMPAGQRLLELE
jgi:hypothetical protein